MRIPFRGPNDLKRMRLSQRGPVTLTIAIYPGDRQDLMEQEDFPA